MALLADGPNLSCVQQDGFREDMSSRRLLTLGHEPAEEAGDLEFD